MLGFDALTLAWIGLATLAAFIVRGLSGFGSSMIGIGALSMVLPPAQVVPAFLAVELLTTATCGFGASPLDTGSPSKVMAAWGPSLAADSGCPPSRAGTRASKAPGGAWAGLRRLALRFATGALRCSGSWPVAELTPLAALSIDES